MLIVYLLQAYAAPIKLSVNYDASNDKWNLLEGEYDEKADARGMFDYDVNVTGWNHIQVEGKRDTDDYIVARGAGFIEGYLTAHLLRPHMRNIYANLCNDYVKCENGQLPQPIQTFFNNNYDWTKREVDRGPATTDPYYFAAKITMLQLKGLVEGYNAKYPNDPITEKDLWVYYGQLSIPYLARMKYGDTTYGKDGAPKFARRGTAIVGQTAKPDDIFISHATWRPYGEVQRLTKRYRLRFHSNLTSVDRRSFSSYPFMLHSDDEFMITDIGLAIVSSGIAMTDDKLSSKSPAFQGYPHWFRGIVASLMAHSCDEWSVNYRTLACDGPGIEYLVVDIKKFKYKEGFLDEFVYAIDEIPGMVRGVDITPRLRDKRFVASYDVPYISEVYTAAGYDTLAASDPDMYSYENSFRAKILQREAQTFHEFMTMKKLIRLNNPEEVPEQNGSPSNAIAGRHELEKTNPKCKGAIDAKVTSIGRMLHMAWAAQSGPTHEIASMKPFDFNRTSSVCLDSPHEGVYEYMGNKWSDIYFDIEDD